MQDFQIEQDLVIARALVEIFSHPFLRSALAFRGGTALYKLYITPPTRYSEDIDLVQVTAGPIGPALSALRETLDPWLGKPQWRQTEGRVTMNYRFGSEDAPPLPLRLKVEINSREHFALFGYVSVPFAVSSRWFTGSANIATYQLDELLGTKLRALYQRRKGRDLFDLWYSLTHGGVSDQRIVACFSHYMRESAQDVPRAVFEENIANKLGDHLFQADIGPLLRPGVAWNLNEAARVVGERLISRLSGEPWRGDPRPP